MGYAAQPSEKAAVVGVIDPAANAASQTLNSDAVDMSKFSEALFILLVGDIVHTIDAKLQESATSGGTYTDISGKGMTQLAATDDNKQVMFDLKADELGAGKQFVRLQVANGAGAGNSNIAVVALAMTPKHGPASDDKHADVKQIVS